MTVIKYVLAFMLIGHAIAHLPGFIVAWQLGSFPELTFRTTVFGAGLDVGAGGMRVVGLGWILAAVAFIALATAVALDVKFPYWVAPAALGFSVLLCAGGWPEARYGIIANIVIGAGLVYQRYISLTDAVWMS